MLSKFAEELKTERENKGLTLQQVATKTRIDIKFLEAIDQGNFSFLPDLYVKAFIRDYAKTIGLDEKLMMKKYEAAKEGQEYDPNQPEIKPEPEIIIEKETPKQPPQEVRQALTQKTIYENPLGKKPEEEKRKTYRNTILITAGATILLIFAVLYLFVFNKGDKIIVEETPIESAIEQSSQRYEETTPKQNPADSTVNKANTDSLHLTFYAKESSWVNAVLDDNKVQEFTLYPNSKFTISALNNFKITIGNSGGVILKLNDRTVEFSGRSGSVKHFKLDRTGLVYLNAPPKLEN